MFFKCVFFVRNPFLSTNLKSNFKKLEAEIFLSSFLRIFETILKMLFSSLRNANNANEL